MIAIKTAKNDVIEGEPMSIKLLRHELLGISLCLMGTDYINSANAQQTEQQTDQQTIVTKAEAALAAKIKCRDFKNNADGTWTSGPNTKIGANAFPQHTFDIDLATVLNRKCGVAQAIPRNRPPVKSSEPTETPGQASPESSPPAESQESPEPNSDDPDSQGPRRESKKGPLPGAKGSRRTSPSCQGCLRH
jgi:hypothetical protein